MPCPLTGWKARVRRRAASVVGLARGEREGRDCSLLFPCSVAVPVSGSLPRMITVLLSRTVDFFCEFYNIPCIYI